MSVQAVQTLVNAAKRAAFKAIRINDGAANDTLLKVVDASTLKEPGSVGDELLTITNIIWSVGGPTAGKTVTLYWDGTPDKEIMNIAGNGSWNLTSMGMPSIANNASTPTGDILLSTTGFVSGDFYTIILEVRKVSGYSYVSSSSSSSSSSSNSSSSSSST